MAQPSGQLGAIRQEWKEHPVDAALHVYGAGGYAGRSRDGHYKKPGANPCFAAEEWDLFVLLSHGLSKAVSYPAPALSVVVHNVCGIA